MKLPVLVVNFKTYKEAMGRNALRLSKICEQVSKDLKTNIVLAPQFTDLEKISRDLNLPIFSQHMDTISYGSHTGHILPEAVKKSGAAGTLLNHSERKMSLKEIEEGIKRARDLEMETIVCVQSPEQATEVAELHPDYIAYEPPELIGTKKSVSTSKPEVVRTAVEHVNSVNDNIEVLTGAGINDREDVEKALELGTRGVLVASGIIKSDNIEKSVSNLVKGL